MFNLRKKEMFTMTMGHVYNSARLIDRRQRPFTDWLRKHLLS